MKRFDTFEGIYEHFRDVPAEGPGHLEDIWVQKSLKKLAVLCDALGEGRQRAPFPDDSAALLAMSVLPMLSSTRALTVLDFGGGVGITYLGMRLRLPKMAAIAYHIVDNEKVCAGGRSLLGEPPGLFFHVDAAHLPATIDLIHFGSSLQYVEDWKVMLQVLVAYAPRRLLLTDIPAGDIPTYASAQNYYDSKIPHWFFNIDEVVSAVRALGFVLVFTSPFHPYIPTPTRFSRDQELPQHNFPKTHRVGQTANLLFARTTEDV